MTDPRVEALLEALCNCARSRGRHSTYCPTLTARPNILIALAAFTAAGS